MSKWSVAFTSGAFIDHMQVEAPSGGAAIELALAKMEDEAIGWPSNFSSAAITIYKVEEATK